MSFCAFCIYTLKWWWYNCVAIIWIFLLRSVESDVPLPSPPWRGSYLVLFGLVSLGPSPCFFHDTFPSFFPNYFLIVNLWMMHLTSIHLTSHRSGCWHTFVYFTYIIHAFVKCPFKKKKFFNFNLGVFLLMSDIWKIIRILEYT